MALMPTSADSMEDTFLTTFFASGFTSAQFYFLSITILWLGSIGGALAFGYLLGPLFLFLHKKTIGRNMQYGVSEVIDPNPDKFKGAFKSFWPALMALNLAFLLAQTASIQTLVMNPEVIGSPGDVNRLIFFFLSFTGLIGIGGFSGAWSLDDCGLVYSNEELSKKKKKIREARSVGGWYVYFLKGYAGISVIIALYTFLGEYIASGIQLSGFIFFALYPLVVMILMIPAIILLEITAEHRKNYMMKYIRKFGISDELSVKVEKNN